jgi:tetratricopeptide (TPR) repeat protein
MSKSKKKKKSVIQPDMAGAKTEGGVFPISPHSRGRTILVLSIILLLTIAVYSNSINNGFTNWDDNKNVYENIAIREISIANIKTYFTKPLVAMYTPLAYISFAIDYRIGGLDPRIYHLTNLILHLLNICLVFFIVGRFTQKKEIAAVVALFFAIHTMNVGTVAWVSGRSTLLFSFFYLAAFYSYLLYLDNKFRNSYLVYAIILFSLSLLSKSAAVTLPVLLLLTDHYFKRKIDKRTLVEKVPFFALSVVFGMLTFIFRHDAGNLVSIYAFSLIERVFLICYALVFYIVKLFLPINLSPYYPYPDKVAGMLPLEFYLSPLVLAGIAGLIIWAGNFRRELIFGAGFYLVHIALLLRIIPMGGEIVCDRYMYLSGIGIFLILGWAYSKAKEGRGLIGSRIFIFLSAVITIAVLILSIMSYDKVRIWKDNLTLYEDILAKYPDVSFAYYNRGNARMEQKDYAGAVMDFSKAVDLEPGYIRAYVNRGNARMEQKDYAGATADFDRALELNPHLDTAYFNRGNARLQQKDYAGALADFDRALELNPHLDTAYFNRGNIRLQQKDYVGAVTDFSKAIEINPAYVEAYNNRGNIRMQQKDYAGAASDFSKAAELRPYDAGLLFNRGIVKALLNDQGGACSDWKESSRLGDAEANNAMRRYCR